MPVHGDQFRLGFEQTTAIGLGKRKVNRGWRLVSIPGVTMLLAFVSLTFGIVPVGRAQSDTDLASTALTLTPRDAAFFATSVNLGQAWDDFLTGNLVLRLRAVPIVQAWETELDRQWENPDPEFAQVKAALDNPNVRNLLQLLRDMGSEECFVYGSDEWCDMIEGFVDFQTRLTQLAGEDPEAVANFLNNLGRADVDRLRIPTTVFGFRLPDDQNARLQLDAFEGILRLAGGQLPDLQPLLKNLRRTDLRDGQTLTLTLDTSLIPMHLLDGEGKQVAEKVIELLEGRRFSFSVGVKANILLLAFGEDGTVIDTFGEVPDSLLSHEVMTVLKEADHSRLRSINFASERWRQSQWNANFNQYFQRLSMQFTMAIEGAADEIEDVDQWKAEIQQDAVWMDERLSDFAPSLGDMLAWSRATQGGLEGWTYDWSENITFENASPLKVLQHAGTDSLLLLAFKQQQLAPAAQELIDHAIERAPSHLKRFIAAAEEDAEDREKILLVFDRSWRLFEEALEIFRDKIAPAIADESLLSMSGKWTTSEIPGLPSAGEPLPLPELAVACTLVDREQFIEGCSELYGLLDQVVELVKDVDPNAIPESYQIPRPLEEKVGAATRYYYAELVDPVPLDGFKPQLLVSDQALVLGYSDRQVTDMLESKELTTRPAWLTNDTPVAAVTYVDFAGMVSAARPWIKYGLTFSDVPLDQPLATAPVPVPTGNDLLQIWDCFKSLGKSAGTMTVGGSAEPTVLRWVWIGQ